MTSQNMPVQLRPDSFESLVVRFLDVEPRECLEIVMDRDKDRDAYTKCILQTDLFGLHYPEMELLKHEVHHARNLFQFFSISSRITLRMYQLERALWLPVPVQGYRAGRLFRMVFDCYTFLRIEATVADIPYDGGGFW